MAHNVFRANGMNILEYFILLEMVKKSKYHTMTATSRETSFFFSYFDAVSQTGSNFNEFKDLADSYSLTNVNALMKDATIMDEQLPTQTSEALKKSIEAKDLQIVQFNSKLETYNLDSQVTIQHNRQRIILNLPSNLNIFISAVPSIGIAKAQLASTPRFCNVSID
ncbi:hypothetical protein RND71_035429 [Anisodus tanguticus]|uniref:Uncharacterized protein n=1 Tax=Anisodus tanguticus TaxID=243964 RepID=A0AAE1R574_9SOLA|nr:hypothetical protein RND71_035429 [Anisodus tanguticus]